MTGLKSRPAHPACDATAALGGATAPEVGSTRDSRPRRCDTTRNGVLGGSRYSATRQPLYTSRLSPLWCEQAPWMPPDIE